MGELIAFDLLVFLVNIIGFLIFAIPAYKFVKGVSSHCIELGKEDEGTDSLLSYLGKRKGRILIWVILLLIALRVSAYEGAIKPVSELPKVNVERQERLEKLDKKEILVPEVEEVDHEAEKQRLIEENKKAKERFKSL